MNRLRATLHLYRKQASLFALFSLPLAYFLIFQYGPIYGLIMAFEDFYPRLGVLHSPWVGLKHFKVMFGGLYFLPVLRNTLVISFLKLLVGFPAPIILALMLNEVRNVPFKRTVQTITYLPHFVSWVVLAGLVIEMLSPSRGPVNALIKALGFKPIFFVADPHWFRAVLVSSSVWKGIGWGSIVYLAAITGIDPQLYEAAHMDGASKLRQLWSITLPTIAPVVVVMLLFSLGSIINDDFEQILNLLNANVMSVGDVIMTYTYREGLQNLRYSYATAVGLFKNVVAFVLVLAGNTFARRISDYSIW